MSEGSSSDNWDTMFDQAPAADSSAGVALMDSDIGTDLSDRDSGIDYDPEGELQSDVIAQDQAELLRQAQEALKDHRE